MTSHFGVSLDEIRNGGKQERLVEPRHIIHYLLTVNQDYSLTYIGGLTLSNHSTVLHSRNLMESRIGLYAEQRNHVIEICKKITNMKIQIIGKITGLPRMDVIIKFKESEQQLLASGYSPVNPLNLVPAGMEWGQAMRLCIKSLLEVDGVALQSDWSMSAGAKLEFMIASHLNLKIIKL